MGRTVHTRILRTAPIERETWRKIDAAAIAMNDRFTWTCESFRPSLVDKEDRRRDWLKPDALSEPPVQAYDMTKVANDDWNALLIVRFMRWVSTLVPDAVVKICDEGRYILTGDLLFLDGWARLDQVGILRTRVRLYETGRLDILTGFQQAVRTAEAVSQYFRPIRAIDYADRKEIADLGHSKRELATLSIDAVANDIRFPWQEQAA